MAVTPQLTGYACANPNKLLFASGTGANQHLTGELFKFETATQIDHVPFKQATPRR